MKNKHEEYHLQCQVVRWLELQYPDVLFNGSPGGVRYGSGREAIIRGAMMKRAGATKGWPDLCIYQLVMDSSIPQGYWCGLAIELKTPTGRVEPEQKEVLARLENAGWKTAICRTFEEAQKRIVEYLT